MTPAIRGTGSASATRFLAASAAWLLGLFGVLRLAPVRDQLLLPLAQAQAWLATGGDPAGAGPVVITAECSAGDVIALLAAVVLAYPSSWARRLAALAGGLGLLLAVNTLRIATLTRAAGTPAFEPLHVYLWPAVLAGVAALYALGWMWSAGQPTSAPGVGRWLAAAGATTGLSCAFFLLSPAMGRSAVMAAVTEATAAAAVVVMSGAGLAVRADGTQVVTAGGRFLVTPECVITPLMPIYLAAALVLTRTWRARLGALALFLPVFAALGIARLFTLAVPAAVTGSPLFLIHGFYQLALGLALVVGVGWSLSDDKGSPTRRVRLLASMAAAVVFTLTAGTLRTLIELEAPALAGWAPHTLRRLAAPDDAQGALFLLPAYQLALFSGLWLARFGPRRLPRAALGLAVLHLGHLVLMTALGELAWHAAVQVPVAVLRAWALLGPVALFVALSPTSRPEPRAAPPIPVPA